MPAPGGPLVGLGRRQPAPAFLGLMAQGLVHLTNRFPVGRPIRPLGGPGHGVIEVVDVDASGDEARPPMVCRHLHAVGGVVRAHEAAILVPLTASSRLDPRSRRNTSAQLRPGKPETEPPGWVQAPVWYRPSIGVRYDDQPSTGLKKPLCSGELAPPWHEPRQLAEFLRSRSRGESTCSAMTMRRERFGDSGESRSKSSLETSCLIVSQCSGPCFSSYGRKLTTLKVCLPAGARVASMTEGVRARNTGSSRSIRPARKAESIAA